MSKVLEEVSLWLLEEVLVWLATSATDDDIKQGSYPHAGECPTCRHDCCPDRRALPT